MMSETNGDDPVVHEEFWAHGSRADCNPGLGEEMRVCMNAGSSSKPEEWPASRSSGPVLSRGRHIVSLLAGPFPPAPNVA